MTKTKFEVLLSELDDRKKLVREYLANDEYINRFQPKHIQDAAYSYINLGGKSLRPAVLLLSCGAVGGDENLALPAAAAIEVYHTWTLVHDDIIDKDEKRRGSPTVHAEFTEKAHADLGWTSPDTNHYGLTIAILAGDLQQAWAWSLICELFTKRQVDPALVVHLGLELATYVQPTLIEGETLDVQYSKTKSTTLTQDLIVSMLWKKTGVLYEFAGRAGATIGLGKYDPQIPLIKAIASFCSKCGTAFQIQDDILGIVGDESQLGKPVGSDIREGKRTLIVLKALEVSNTVTQQKLLHTLGNPNASSTEIQEASQIMRELGAIEYTQKLSRKYVTDALDNLKIVPDSKYKTLLQDWANYLVEREF